MWRSFLLTLLLALLPAAASADLYQWEDENGTLHFSDQPPRGSAPQKPMRIAEPVPEPEPASPPAAPDPAAAIENPPPSVQPTAPPEPPSVRGEPIAPPEPPSANDEPITPVEPPSSPDEAVRHAAAQPPATPPAREAKRPSATSARAAALETWTLPLALPAGEQSFRMRLPAEWQPLDRASLDEFEERVRQSGGDIHFRSGFQAGAGRMVLISFQATAPLAGAVARLPRLPAGWSDPTSLPEGTQVFDEKRGVVWQRKPEPQAQVVSALVILDEGKLDITLVTPHDRYDEDLRALARAADTLELPEGAASPDLTGAIGNVQTARGTVAGVLAGVLLVIAWPLLRRIEGRWLRAGLQTVAALGTFLMIALLANFWAADPVRGGQSWFLTILALGIPLEWWRRRRAARTVEPGRVDGPAGPEAPDGAGESGEFDLSSEFAREG